ncbi:Cytochrome P450 [Naviculisporaceae sp. PSN 640]
MNGTHLVDQTVLLPQATHLWYPPVASVLHILPYLIPFLLVSFSNRLFFKSPSQTPGRSPRLWRTYHWPVIGSSIAYFNKRKDMILEGRDTVPGRYFSFFVGAKHVVALSGLEGRKMFFENKQLNLAQGSVELLMGKPPSLKNPDDYGLTYLVKPLSALLQSHELSKRVPRISKDVDLFTQKLLAQPPSRSNPEWRVTNIYDSGPHLAFGLMHRAVGFTEMADSPSLIRKTRNFYHRFEKHTSSAHIIFPWLITPSYLTQGFLAARMWWDMYSILSNRRQTPKHDKQKVEYDDAIQVLIDKGSSNYDIMQFVFFLFIAGLGTTSFGVSWMVILLARHPEWQARCREEVQHAIHKARQHPQQSDNEVLATFTLQQWEGQSTNGNEFPVLNACLKEALRILLPGAMFRKNISGKDIIIPVDCERGTGEQVIPTGAYAVYSVADTHMDDKLYPEAERYDPSRWLEEDDARRGQQEPHTYLAWGSGRHACAGQRLARLLVSITSAHMLANFDFELSDQDGNENTDGSLPPWSTNSHRLEVNDEPIFVRYKPGKASSPAQ